MSLCAALSLSGACDGSAKGKSDGGGGLGGNGSRGRDGALDVGDGASSGGDGRDSPTDAPGTGPWRWGPVQKDHCVGEGLIQVSAPLKNVPAGLDPEMVCRHAPRNVMGTQFAHPDRCVTSGSEWRGQWDVPDTSCVSTPPHVPTRGGDGTLSSASPLEGYADLHLHHMGHLGFGGTIVWGAPFGPPATVLTPIPQAMKLGHDRSEALFDNDIIGGVAGTTTHGESGYPDFRDWPSRTIATHQQVYEDWLFRAYQGGLRLMVMLAVNSEDMFGRGENDLSILGTVSIQTVKLSGRSGNDMESLEWQIRETYRMQEAIDARYGGAGSGWYRIVRDPDEASAVIAQGKMAVVLGTELQHLFNCDSDRPACTSETIVEGLDRLEAMGVNYVFPIHHKLNQFGGPAQFVVLTNGPTEDCFETSEPCSSAGLTPLGRFLIQELSTRGMLVDTEHMSWKAFSDTMDVVEPRDYPVMASHLHPFDLRADTSQTEYARKTDQIQRILSVGGMIGLIAGVGAEEYSPNKTTPVRVPISCGGADQWANAYLYTRDLAGGGLSGTSGRITYGSDWNGFAGWPGPRFGATPCTPRSAKNGQAIPRPSPVAYPIAIPRQLVPAAVGGSTPSLPRFDQFHPWDYNDLGLTHAGLIPDFFEDLRLTGLTLADLEPVYRSARGLVELWRAARDREVPGDRHRLRWTPSSPFDILEFAYADASRNVEARTGFPLCRSRGGHRLGFEQGAVCHIVDGDQPQSSPGTPLRPVAISAYHAGRCLQAGGLFDTGNGAKAQQATCNAATNQQWQLSSDDGQLWTITSVGSGRCLEVDGSSTATGAAAVQRTCNGAANQKWKAVRSGNTFSLRASHSGLCLEVSGESRADGAAVVQVDCSGASHQQWEIESLRSRDYDRLYQVDRNRIAWMAAADAAHPFAVTTDGIREICRSADADHWVGIVSGASCRGKAYDGSVATTPTFERLFQAR